MVKPTDKKQAVSCLIKEHQISERAACGLAGLSRTGYRYAATPRDDGVLRARLKALASEYTRYGYLLLHALLKAEGLVINKKRTHRIYTEEKLQVPRMHIPAQAEQLFWFKLNTFGVFPE